jgi:hypothetical protein
MTTSELRRWAVEQAVASFGADGCGNDSMMEQRIELFLRTVESRFDNNEERRRQLQEAVI